jgi:hypothetical protein
MHCRLCRTVKQCGCHERVVEDVHHTAIAPVGLNSGAGPSSIAGTSFGAGHEDISELRLDTTTDILSQLEDAPNVMQPSLGGLPWHAPDHFTPRSHVVHRKRDRQH